MNVKIIKTYKVTRILKKY